MNEAMNEAGKTPHPPASPSPAPAPSDALLSIEDFKRLQLRVGVILEAADHPNADRLFVVKVDLGESQPRQLVAGIKGAYQASELVGKRVVVVANMKPAMLRGVESQGMILAASDAAQLAVVTIEKAIQVGSPVK